MKNIILFLFVFLGFTSCGLLDEIIPDIDTEYDEIFTIPVTDNSGYTDPQLIDVSSSSEYENFENNIDGFEINEIKLEVISFDGPSDMYFNGQVLALDTAMQNETVVGNIQSINIKKLVDADSVYTILNIITGIQQVEAWLEDPGSFYGLASYNLTDEAGDPYFLDDKEYELQLRLKYDVTVITVASNDDDSD